MTISATAVASVLGGRRTLGRRIRTLDDLRKAVESGLPIEALERTIRRVAGQGPAASELKYRIVPKATLQRRVARLSPEESQRLERLARMAALAEAVWEDAALAREFLSSPQPQLGRARPIDLAPSDLGTRQVEELLFRLEYSLPA
ncbi:MAG: antitoxin Xre/MbcA/ParS toxin-binding domain-containing protein [Candidatus Latescibacterota bacterium]